jgi:hypothetical protein
MFGRRRGGELGAVEHGRMHGWLGGEDGGGLGVGAARGIASCRAGAAVWSAVGVRCSTCEEDQGFLCLQGVRPKFEMEKDQGSLWAL